ncbi:hypothetical protein GGX14DRAFT_472903, partial [Mycena pura]
MATARPPIIGLSTGPEPPYPLQMEGKVISGFGRGAKELGFPTANLPVNGNLTPWIVNIESGVYFGWASLCLPSSHPKQPTTSPDTAATTTTQEFYKNTVRSAEVHVLHEFGAAFYGAEMRLLITGFIREEKDYPNLEALIEDINVDCEVARKSLDREAWALRETGKGRLDGSWLTRAG